MKKKSLLNKYKGGITFYFKSDKGRSFPDYWLVDEDNTKDGELYLLAYDANLFGSPNVKSWKSHAIKEVSEFMSDMFKDEDFDVYLDGHKLDKSKRKLV